MEYLKWVLACLGGLFASFFEQYGVAIAIVIGVIVFDFATGLAKAKVTGEGFSSRKGTIGFWKKMALLMGLAFGMLLDAAIPFVASLGLNITLPFTMPLGYIVAGYIVINETISICENLYACNDKMLPSWIVRLLKIAGETLDKGNQEEEKTESEKREEK